LTIYGLLGVTLTNINLKVNSDKSQQQTSQQEPSLKIISPQGDIAISNKGSTTAPVINRYNCRDISIQSGKDVKINFMTLMLTNYQLGSQTVNISAEGTLHFPEALSVSGGGNFIFRGKKGLSFE
jgi:hypothetical protein